MISHLRQRVPAGNEGGGAPGGAAHPDIHLQKVHPTAAPFPPLLSLKRKREGNGEKDPPTDRPPRNQPGRTSGVAPNWSASRWGQKPRRSSPGGLRRGWPSPEQRRGSPTPPTVSRRPSPRRRACPVEPRHHPSIHPNHLLSHPRRELSPIAGPCRQRRYIPPAPARVSCRGQRLPAFRSRLRGLLTKDF